MEALEHRPPNKFPLRQLYLVDRPGAVQSNVRLGGAGLLLLGAGIGEERVLQRRLRSHQCRHADLCVEANHDGDERHEGESGQEDEDREGEAKAAEVDQRAAARRPAPQPLRRLRR